MTNPAHFQLLHTDSHTGARRSTLVTNHGAIQLPTFMPVGTLATVKGLTIDQILATQSQIILANTYHLALRPGSEVVKKFGGLHEFMGWDRPILTDSGGFQIFSLAKMAKITEQGAVFRSHIDGSQIELTPERAIQIQQNLNSDIAMVLDHVVALPNTQEMIQEAMQRSIRWASRCQKVAVDHSQAVFAIVQGGLDAELRRQCAEQLAEMDFPGYAIGGLSVGETPAQMYQTLEMTIPHLPKNRPRYLMGVGTPRDLLESIHRGVDMFDCVMPTRNGRNALAFTDEGPLRLRNLKHQTDDRPLDEKCPCLACKHPRGYLRHLFIAGEMLGPILLSHHNVTYYQRLMSDAREAIEQDQFENFYQRKIASWNANSTDQELQESATEGD